MNAIKLYRIGHWCYKKHIPLIPKFMKYLTFLLFNSVIPYTCEIGKNTSFAYGAVAVVLHATTIIGDNCVIGTCVTLGGNKTYKGGPTIGDNCYIATGAKVLGPIIVGSGSFVGANTVVTRNVPEKSLVSGIPGKVIKENINISEYSRLFSAEKQSNGKRKKTKK